MKNTTEEKTKLAVTKCAACQKPLELNPKRVRVLFDDIREALLYHPDCAKKITGGKSTGRPTMDDKKVQNKKIHIKLRSEDKEYIKEVSKELGVAMGVLIKRAVKKFMTTNPNPDSVKDQTDSWLNPDTDDSLIIAVTEAEQDAIRDYAAMLDVEQSVLLVQTTLDYFLEAL